MITTFLAMNKDYKRIMQEICMRAPFGVKIMVPGVSNPVKMTSFDCDGGYVVCGSERHNLENCRLVLRPLSAMTTCEKRSLLFRLFGRNSGMFDITEDCLIVGCNVKEQDLNDFRFDFPNLDPTNAWKIISYLLERGIDFNGMIADGLAMEDGG